MSEGDVPVKIIEDQEDEVVGYQPPPQKSIAEILAADEDDESLRKYKAALLGTDAEPIVVGELCVFFPESSKYASLSFPNHLLACVTAPLTHVACCD